MALRGDVRTYQIIHNDISDGYHTFDDLYEHRHMLFLSLCMQDHKKCCWKLEDSEWFILFWESPRGQISYHLPMKKLCFVKDIIKQNQDKEFDGHTPNSVLALLEFHILDIEKSIKDTK